MASLLFSELFVNNLEGTATEEALKSLFSPYGIVESCWVTEKKGNAFGVVRFQTNAEAVAAKKALNHHKLASGRVIGVKWASNQRVLWVGCLPEGVTNEGLKAAFGQFGSIDRALVVLDTLTGASRRYGFVAFKDRKQAQQALHKCQEQALLLGGGLVPVRVALAFTDDWDQGLDAAAKAGQRAGPGAKKPVAEADDAPARLATPGTADHALALRFRALQGEYQAAKALLRMQLQQAERAVLAGGQPPGPLQAHLPSMKPAPPAGPPPPVPPPGMPGALPPRGPMSWALATAQAAPPPGMPGPAPPPGPLGARRDRPEPDLHQVPPAKRMHAAAPASGAMAHLHPAAASQPNTAGHTAASYGSSQYGTAYGGFNHNGSGYLQQQQQQQQGQQAAAAQQQVQVPPPMPPPQPPPYTDRYSAAQQGSYGTQQQQQQPQQQYAQQQYQGQQGQGQGMPQYAQQGQAQQQYGGAAAYQASAYGVPQQQQQPQVQQGGYAPPPDVWRQ